MSLVVLTSSSKRMSCVISVAHISEPTVNGEGCDLHWQANHKQAGWKAKQSWCHSRTTHTRTRMRANSYTGTHISTHKHTRTRARVHMHTHSHASHETVSVSSGLCVTAAVSAVVMQCQQACYAASREEITGRHAHVCDKLVMRFHIYFLIICAYMCLCVTLCSRMLMAEELEGHIRAPGAEVKAAGSCPVEY